MSLCPEPCGPDSSPGIYKTLLMCLLLLQVLDSNGIIHTSSHTQGSAEQGQILLPSADLHHHSGDENLTQGQLNRKRKINLMPPLYSPSTFPSPLSLGHPAGGSAPLYHQGIAAH